jgi:hypothetical protein
MNALLSTFICYFCYILLVIPFDYYKTFKFCFNENYNLNKNNNSFHICLLLSNVQKSRLIQVQKLGMRPIFFEITTIWKEIIFNRTTFLCKSDLLSRIEAFINSIIGIKVYKHLLDSQPIQWMTKIYYKIESLEPLTGPLRTRDWLVKNPWLTRRTQPNLPEYIAQTLTYT